MREALQTHAPAVVAFVVMLVIAGGFATALRSDLPQARAVPALPHEPVPLPGPHEDADRDTYADDVDLWDGDLVLVVEALRLRGGSAPYLLVGTQDDQWRLGAGAELAWRHVVDHDPLGHAPGSPAWQDDALRTGVWWTSIPADGEDHLGSGSLDPGAEGVLWPQAFYVNVRDDRNLVSVRIELWDQAPSPDRLLAGWDVAVDVASGHVLATDARVVGDALRLGPDDGPSLDVRVEPQSGLDAATKQALAARHAPTLHFAAGERFFPTNGETLARFHGFTRPTPDLRTWERSFNNGRDGYRLLLADFDGNGRVEYEDAAIMTDVLRSGEANDTVYVHVTTTTGGAVVIQYWFLSMYNYVLDETGQDIRQLAHNGDREFIQLRFADLEAARDGAPETVTYSQHYYGVRIEDARPGLPPYVDGGPDVYVALGSHASYPAPGDDRALRPGYVGFGDVFDGEGERWEPGDYDLQVLGTQEWAFGHLWGPMTRYHRDLGTSLRPILQHDFRYPYLDPIVWERSIPSVPAADLADLYGGAS